MAPSYISLAYLIDFRMIKLYLLCWQTMEEVHFTSISRNLSICGMSERQVLSLYWTKTYLDIVTIATTANLFSSGAPQFFPSFSSDFTCFWSANSDCSASYVILWTYRARCALNKEILDLLNEESVSGACSCRDSL